MQLKLKANHYVKVPLTFLIPVLPGKDIMRYLSFYLSLSLCVCACTCVCMCACVCDDTIFILKQIICRRRDLSGPWTKCR